MSFSRQALRQWRASKQATYFLSLGSRQSYATYPRVDYDPNAQRPPPDDAEERPRWSYTPERMMAPFSLNPVKDPRRQVWKVNDDPKKLDNMYDQLLGKDLTRILPEELKWLAVTHKSFDYGRRGFNTRLAYFGRQIFALEATRSILTSPVADGKTTPDSYGREPFQHRSLEIVDKLGVRQPQDLISKEQLARLASEVGLPEVMRWKPRLPQNLDSSGIEVVLTSTMFAIIGAVSLHAGGEVASRIMRERILRRLEE